MKTYSKLTIPDDSAWERFSFRRYIPDFILDISTGISNIIKWIPTIYRDRNWDHNFIYEILKKKILFQRDYLVKNNRHMEIARDNRYMTLALNLIERLQESFYEYEHMDYENSEIKFIPTDDSKEYFTIDKIIHSEKYDEYLYKYKSVVRKLLRKDPDLKDDKADLCRRVSNENEARCKALLFRVLSDKINGWWD